MQRLLWASSLTLVYGQATQDSCNALVYSGGGNNGSWEAGVTWGLLHYGDPADF